MCIHWQPDHSTVVLRENEGTRPVIKLACIQDLGTELATVVDGWQAYGSHTVVVVNPAQYQFSLIEKPNVPDTEIREAIRWQLPSDEMLVQDLQDLSIDFIPLPDDAYRNRQQMLYVATMARTMMNAIAQTIQKAGLSMQAIDIPQMSIGHIVSMVSKNAEPLAWIHQGHQQTIINVYANDALYFSREISIDTASAIPADVLEIKRTLDYCRHQIGCPDVHSLWFSPLLTGEVPLFRLIEQELDLTVNTFDLAEWFDCDLPLSPALQSQYLLSIAGSLKVLG